MLQLLRKILVSRGIAAAIGLGTSAFAIAFLPPLEYAAASVGVSYAAIVTAALFFPFSKYILVSGEFERIEALFWSQQPFVMALVATAGVCSYFLKPTLSPLLLMSAAAFAISQGWKEFSGESSRVRKDLKSLHKLYVNDAISTALLTFSLVPLWGSAASFLLCSAASSAFWSWRVKPASTLKGGIRVRAAEIFDVYRYSYGVVGSSSLNAAAIATSRTAIMAASPPNLAGALQFMLDCLQKPMALLASSVTSAAVPEGRREQLTSVFRPLQKIFGVAFLLLLICAVAIQFLSPILTSGGASLTLETAALCALLIWSNRYKSAIMDLPLMCSPRYVPGLLVGSLISVALLGILATRNESSAHVLAGSSLALLTGGAVSIVIACWAKLVTLREAGRVVGFVVLPVVAVTGFHFLR